MQSECNILFNGFYLSGSTCSIPDTRVGDEEVTWVKLVQQGNCVRMITHSNIYANNGAIVVFFAALPIAEKGGRAGRRVFWTWAIWE